MTRTCQSVLIAIGLLTSAGRAPALPMPAKPAASDEERVARVQRILEETEIDATPLANKKMTLAEFLKALEGKLPADKKLSIRLDAESLGKELPRAAGAAVTIKYVSGHKITAAQLLRTALGETKRDLGTELDYAARPDGVVVSFPRFAIYRVVYDIPSRFGRSDFASPELPQFPGITKQPENGADDATQFARLLTTSIELRPGETAELLNGTRLIVSAAGDRHEQFFDLLDQCSRLLDLAVVMNARLFEVDRAFYEKHVAPLFPGKEPPAVVRLDGPMFKKFAGLKPLAVSDGVRLRRGRESLFLSRQMPFRSSAGSGVEGVAFTVDPKFSADRGFIRLKITQKSMQLIGLKRIEVREEANGVTRTFLAEFPDVRTTIAAGVVQIPDSASILMRIDYRPADEAGQDKVWLMVARPIIWIDREMRERYLGEPQDSPRVLTSVEVDRLLKDRGVSVSSIVQECWASELGPEPEEFTGVNTPRATEAVKEILQVVVNDVLKNPKLKPLRDFYGKPGDESFVLDRADGQGWPAEFAPQIYGYKLVKSKPEPFSKRSNVLGLRLIGFDPNPSETEPNPEPIEVCLFNAGGSGNGAVAGCSRVSYSLRRVEKKWVVQLSNVNDP